MVNEYRFGQFYIHHSVDEDPRRYNLPMHIHEECEIYFFLSGDVEYKVEGTSYRLEPKSLLIMRPAESHMARVGVSTSYERYALNFPLSFLHDEDPKGRLLEPFLNRPLGRYNLFTAEELDVEMVERLFAEMCEPDDDYNRQLTLSTHLFLLMDMIRRAASKRQAEPMQPQTLSETMVSYVNRNLFEELSIPMLAQHFFLSTSQFSRVFRQATGSAPWEYIIRKRLSAAGEQIHSGVPAQEACFLCGFKDYSSFYRAFVKYRGCAPTSLTDVMEQPLRRRNDTTILHRGEDR